MMIERYIEPVPENTSPSAWLVRNLLDTGRSSGDVYRERFRNRSS